MLVTLSVFMLVGLLGWAGYNLTGYRMMLEQHRERGSALGYCPAHPEGHPFNWRALVSYRAYITWLNNQYK